MTDPARLGHDELAPEHAEALEQVDRVRTAVREMRAHLDVDRALLTPLLTLVELAARWAATVIAANAHSARRAARTGGDGHTFSSHGPEWACALEVTQAWEDGDRG